MIGTMSELIAAKTNAAAHRRTKKANAMQKRCDELSRDKAEQQDLLRASSAEQAQLQRHLVKVSEQNAHLNARLQTAVRGQNMGTPQEVEELRLEAEHLR